MRGQKGITLVALIITIIVLLILAVVAIGSIQESRIIDHAQNASGSWTNEQAAEAGNIAAAEGMLDNIVKDLATE